MMMISLTEIVTRLTVAFLFGAIIGLERERKNWAAGLRTHMMVCVGASLIMIVSTYGFADVPGTKNIELDPSGIAAQVVSGIGFIGAGTILFLRQGIVRGLTTASGLWTVTAIGLAAGSGMYFAALITTILAIIILWVLQPLERRVSEKYKHKSVKLITADKEKSIEIVNQIFQNINVDLSAFLLDKTDNDFIISFKFKKIYRPEIARMINDFQSDAAIKEVVWSN